MGRSYTDAAGNAGAAGSDDVAIDRVNPTVTVTIVDAALSDGDASSVVTFTFIEAVDPASRWCMRRSGGTLSALTWNAAHSV